MDIIDSIIRGFVHWGNFPAYFLGIKFIHVQQEVFQIARTLSVCCQSCNNSINIRFVIIYKKNRQPVVLKLEFFECVIEAVFSQSASLRINFPLGQLD